MKGFRQVPQESRKDKIRALEAELKNMSVAMRISQAMTQQLMQNNAAMQQDLGRSLNLINELQYKVLAVQKVANLDPKLLATHADELRLKDFNEASDKEDAAEGNTLGTTVNNESIVILTSTTEDPDKGIFRSKLKLAECGVPDLIKALDGREAGAKAIVKLNDVEHTVELLKVLQPPKAEPVPQVEGNA